MLMKLLFSLLGLLASLVGVLGVVRLGWKWELIGVAAVTLASLALSIALGNREALVQRLQEAGDGDGGDGESRDVRICSSERAAALQAAISEEETMDLPDTGRNTSRFGWDQISSVVAETAGPERF